jgi:hypothetical protein
MKGRQMEKQYVVENSKSRERLRKLVSDITDEELKLVIYKEGWTIAAALAHIAFWDERRVVLMRKSKQKSKIHLGDLEMDVYHVFNDTMLPFLLEIPPRKAANLAVLAAEKVDRELEKATPALIAALKASGYRLAFNRSVHRKMHLDEIEALLKSKRR